MEGPQHAKHGSIDTNTIRKMIFRTSTAGQLQYVSVALPQCKGSANRLFVVAAGVPLDESFLRKVSSNHESSPLNGMGTFRKIVYCTLTVEQQHYMSVALPISVQELGRWSAPSSPV